MKGETLLKSLETLTKQETIMNDLMPINLTTKMKWTNFLKDRLPILTQEVTDNLNSPTSIQEIKYVL